VYLTSAFLPFLSILSERGMSNLRDFSGFDGSIPPAGTIILNRLAGSIVPRGCTVVAQRFSFFHGISRGLGHLFHFM
jgi:hypothetical protein